MSGLTHFTASPSRRAHSAPKHIPDRRREVRFSASWPDELRAYGEAIGIRSYRELDGRPVREVGKRGEVRLVDGYGVAEFERCLRGSGHEDEVGEVRFS